MNKAAEHAIDAMTASNMYKPLYNNNAISYVKTAQTYLGFLKKLGDSRAELTLTGGDYATLQEKVDHAYELCNQIVNIKVTADNYTQYEAQILSVIREVYAECIGIQKISVELLEAFV